MQKERLKMNRRGRKRVTKKWMQEEKEEADNSLEEEEEEEKRKIIGRKWEDVRENKRGRWSRGVGRGGDGDNIV